MSELDEVSADRPRAHLTLTARLNTSALDNRRGVIRLHPEAIAALGIREWDAVSLTGSRSTAAVAGVAARAAPAGTARLEDVSMFWAYIAMPVGGVFCVIALIGNLIDPRRHELETAQ